jgi:ketosteroid isomerase-like protein
MSDPRLDVIEGAYAAVRDRRFRDWAARTLPADLEWHPPPEAPDFEVRHGPGAIARYFDAVLEDAAVWEPRIIGVAEAETGTLVISAEATAESRHGVSMEVEFAQVWEFVGEQPIRVREFLSHGQALEAAGLSE